jgi:polynucleotide 5'-kinase involved in rRNA processing
MERRVTHTELIEELIRKRGTTVLLGGIDTGKSSFGLEMAEHARSQGISVAFIDSDISQSTVGPPTSVGLKYCNDIEAVTPEAVAKADELAFVGSTAPEGHLLPLLSGTARLVDHARRAGAELIIVDTTGYISGYYAEILKYYKLEQVRPDAVIGFQRGEELEPILGVVRRFFPVEVTSLKVASAVVERSVEDRLIEREQRLATYFQPPLSRWRLKTSVFMPTIPPGVDLAVLDGLVVGLEDGKGTCTGIGLLEYDKEEGVLRLASPVDESAKGLRLGSVKLTTEGRMTGRVTLRELFGN